MVKMIEKWNVRKCFNVSSYVFGRENGKVKERKSERTENVI